MLSEKETMRYINNLLENGFDAEVGFDSEHKGDTVIFYRKHKSDKMWKVRYPELIGPLAVTFDKKHILNLWRDYPQNFTQEQRDILWEEWPNLPAPIKHRGK